MNSFTLTMYARARKKGLKTAGGITPSVRAEQQSSEKNHILRIVHQDKRQLQLNPGSLTKIA